MVEDIVVDEHLVSLVSCHVGHLVTQPPPLLLACQVCQGGATGQPQCIWGLCQAMLQMLLGKLVLEAWQLVMQVVGSITIPLVLYTVLSSVGLHGEFYNEGQLWGCIEYYCWHFICRINRLSNAMWSGCGMYCYELDL